MKIRTYYAGKQQYYVVAVDEDIWTVDELEEWSRYFEMAASVKDLALLLVKKIDKYGIENHIEGFGQAEEIHSGYYNFGNGITVEFKKEEYFYG